MAANTSETRTPSTAPAQAGQLEQFHWFVRAHLESPDGTLVTAGARTEKTAAKRAKR